jgi:O-antigen/teichoic acid export membrane protein
MAFVNLILSIYLCQRYGAIGSAIGTAISLILANGFIINIYYHLKCNIDIIKFWKNILYLSKGLIIPVFMGIIIKYFSLVRNNIDLVIWIGIFSFIYVVSMWNLGMNNVEKTLILEPLRRHKKRE